MLSTDIVVYLARALKLIYNVIRCADLMATYIVNRYAN
jgi:hypothetical protein